MRKTLNVALYYPWLYLKSGGERTISELVSRSRHNWTILTNRYEADSTFEELRRAKVMELSRVSVKRTFRRVTGAATLLIRQKLPLANQDALVVFCEGIGDLITFRNHQIPAICVCLTPLRAAFDPVYQAEYLRMHNNRWSRRMALSLAAGAFRVVDRRAWNHYSHVFAISGEVKRRILAGKLCDEQKITVIYPGIDLSRISPGAEYKKTFLIPGRIMWTKNHELGIDAFVDLMTRRPDLREFNLTIAGFVDEKSRPYIARLRDRASGLGQIQFVESPSDQDLFNLYRSCFAVIYTPLNEDWGLVPIEAMAFEKPVIAVNRGGPLETVRHGETGYLVNPDPKAFSAAMETLADNPELVRRMGEAGRQHVGRFEWKHFCGALDDYLDRVAPVQSMVGAPNQSVEPLASS
jgi:glycosyltransferase involved in cell wall biosynthesis